jgi:anti-sigma regulatory factor (Ser/Thr protein kinase)
VARTQRAERVLPCEPRSAALARRFVEETLHAWHWSDSDDDIVTLLVSELVTNALLHARSEVRVRVSRTGSRIRVAVEDQATRQPARRGHTAGSTTGRGLDLVEALAADWGVETVRGGKAVWFELEASSEDNDRWVGSGRGSR